MIKQEPILITGIPRSGSTALAATINKCGVFVGTMTKRSMFCNDRIREELALVQSIVKNIDEKWNPVNWKTEVADILISQGYKDGQWMYKDSNLSKTWKIWNYAYPNAKWVIVRRRTGDIIQSCMKTGYMIEHSTEEGWLRMVHEYEGRFVDMISEGLNCKIIWPERMVNGDYKQLFELCDWLGIHWNPEALKYIDSLLWKSNKK